VNSGRQDPRLKTSVKVFYKDIVEIKTLIVVLLPICIRYRGQI